MHAHIGRWLKAVAGDQRMVQRRWLYANLLRGTIFFMAAIAVLLFILALVMKAWVVFSIAIPPLAMLCVLVFCWWLNKRGAEASSQKLFLGVNFVAIVASVFLYDGFTSSAVLLLLWPIVLSGVFLRPSFAFGASVLASVVVIIAYLMELGGVYRPPFEPPEQVHLLFTLGANIILFNVLAAFMFMVIHSLNSVLAREQVLSSELQASQQRLEQTVAERTAELTRANLELEQQMAERERVAAELRQLTEFNQELIQNIAEGVVVEDAEGRLTFANPAAANILGYTAEEMIGLHWTTIIPPEQQAVVAAADKRRVRGETDRYETLVQRQDGTLMPVLVSGSPRWDPDTGEFLGTMAVFTNIKELKQAESEREGLLAAEHEQRLLAETLRDVTLALTSHTNHTAVLDEILQQVQRVVPFCAADIALLQAGNLKTARWLGYDQYGGSKLVDKMSRRLADFPYDLEAVESGESVVIADTHQDDHWLVLDETAWIRSALLLPLRWQDQPLGIMHLASDHPGDFSQEDSLKLEPLANAAAIAIHNAQLVQSLEAEVALRTAEIREEKEKSEIILRNVSSAIGMTNLELEIQYVNEAFVKLTGYDASQAVGKEPFFLLAQPLSQQERRLWQLALMRGEVWQQDVVIARRDGRTYDAAVTIVPMRDAEGDLRGYVFSHEDISQRKELDRARSGFMTIVSHALRTPVTNMKLYAQLLQRDPPPDKAQHYLDVLHQQADGLGKLVQDILEITSLDSGQAVRSWTAVNVPSLVGDIVNKYQGAAQKAGVALEKAAIPAGIPMVQGDLARLGQALGEIVENAITFTPDGGRVMVQVAQSPEGGKKWVRVTIRDTGPGIALDEQGRIFERFYRGTLAESGNVPGTGLGLSIAQVIVHAHGGRVIVESQEGEGSAFTLCLPTLPDQSPSMVASIGI